MGCNGYSERHSGRIGRRPSWFVAVRNREGLSPLRVGLSFDTTGFRALAFAPPGRFYADPFVVARPDGGAYVFVEDGPLDGGPARISVLTLDPDGNQQVPGPSGPGAQARTCPTRSSSRTRASWNMLPETAGTGLDRAPTRAGVPVAVGALRDPWWPTCGPGTDAAAARRPLLVVRDRRRPPGPGPSDELCLYSAACTRRVPGVPIPCNPVVSDVRTARPAGQGPREATGACCDLRRTAREPTADGSSWNRIEVLTPDGLPGDARRLDRAGLAAGCGAHPHLHRRRPVSRLSTALRYERRPWVRRLLNWRGGARVGANRP